MYELFILGELMDHPMHGYLLHRIVQTAIGPVRRLSWGMLYPLIRRLEKEGFIVPQAMADPDGEGRPRKAYAITDAGRRRFLELMLQPGAYNADYPDLFHIKLVNFDHIDTAQQLAILRHYRDYLRFQHDALRTTQRQVEAEAHIPATERPHILRVIDHRLHVLGADLDWLNRVIERTANEQTIHQEG